MLAFRTFHNYLHITYKAVDDTQGLCNSHPSLVLGQSIQSLQNRLYLALPQKLLRKFLCGILSYGNVHVTAHLLNRPWLICFVARASTESN